MKPLVQKYEDQLVKEGVLTAEDAQQMREKVLNRFEDAYKLSKEHKFKSEEWVSPQWENIKNANSDLQK